MNVEAATMNIPFRQAHESYKAYAAALRMKPPGDPAAKPKRDDVILYRALKALLRGHQVIDIAVAIGQGGRHANGLPKLAIARADWASVVAHDAWDGPEAMTRGIEFSTSQFGRKPRGRVFLGFSAFKSEAYIVNTGSFHGSAQVPLIPPPHRPPADHDLADYHILFEAEWRKAPAVDPLLLKKVDGPFFVVLAAWALTPLEQAVLRQRL